MHVAHYGKPRKIHSFDHPTVRRITERPVKYREEVRIFLTSSQNVSCLTNAPLVVFLEYPSHPED